MACTPTPASFIVTGTSDGSSSGADGSGAYSPSFGSGAPCVYTYSIAYTITISGSVTQLSTPVGDFTSSTSGSTTVSFNAPYTSGPLEIGWSPTGPPFSVPSGETATLNYTLLDASACWAITGIRAKGRKWQKFGPNRTPSVIIIPKDVDPKSCVIIEDGLLVPSHRYVLISE